jgi:hypothetical protein
MKNETRKIERLEANLNRYLTTLNHEIQKLSNTQVDKIVQELQAMRLEVLGRLCELRKVKEKGGKSDNQTVKHSS